MNAPVPTLLKPMKMTQQWHQGKEKKERQVCTLWFKAKQQNIRARIMQTSPTSSTVRGMQMRYSFSNIVPHKGDGSRAQTVACWSADSGSIHDDLDPLNHRPPFHFCIRNTSSSRSAMHTRSSSSHKSLAVTSSWNTSADICFVLGQLKSEISKELESNTTKLPPQNKTKQSNPVLCKPSAHSSGLLCQLRSRGRS